jgi:hypothetical protein
MIEGGRTVAWLTPHVAVMRGFERGIFYEGQHEMCRVCFKVDDQEINALARSHVHLSEICDVLLRLVVASVAHSVILHEMASFGGALISATSLEYLMEQCQSLIFLSLHDLDINENHCRVLGTYSRPGLEIELYGCRLRGAADGTMAEVLGRNQGPTKLVYCKGEIDSVMLSNGLRGNSRLKRMMLCPVNHDAAGQEILTRIASALKENKGLVGFYLRYDLNESDDT